MFEQIDHIGIAVRDLDEAVERYGRLYGVGCRAIEELEELSVRIAYLPIGEVELELAEPLEGGGRLAEFLDQQGEGFHHVAYRVDDIDAALERLKESGVRLRDATPRPGGEGSRVAFVELAETNGVLTELVERPPQAGRAPKES